MKKILACSVIVLSWLLVGCATHRGVEEFGVYRDAFQQARSASDAILDRVAIAERQLWQYCSNFTELTKQTDFDPLQCERFHPIMTKFRVADTSYLVTAGEPPQTAAIRRTMVAAGAYTEALNGLASGQTSEAVSGQIGQLAGLAAAAAAAVSTGGATGSLATTIAGINSDIATFKVPITTAFGFVSRDELRDQLLKQGSDLKSALDGVKNATPAMFKVLLTAEIVSVPPGSAVDDSRVKADRLLLANWVEMLKASERALDAAIAAADSEDTISVSSALTSAQTLTTLAQDVRKILADDAN
ncbi:hypothetical protein [Vibrio natriegens]|uniref:hypothetical protein n=1 Tax=Vibrio natriegens TaxID=691 RepID=UPI00390A8145